MRTTIRKSTFETNSSSIHALVFVPDDVYAAWQERGYLSISSALDSASAFGAFAMDSPASTHIEDVIDEPGYWERAVAKSGNRAGMLEPEDALEMLEVLPFANLSSTDPYVSRQITSMERNEMDGVSGYLLSLIYDGWR